MTRTKKIFVLNGHPAAQSLNRALAEKYAEAAKEEWHEVRLVHLNDLKFDPDFERAGFENTKPLEPDLETVLGHIEWADHFVMTTPMWWGGLPAKLKGLFDRAFLPGRTFDTRHTTKLGLPAPMLTGRTGRIIMTSDTPRFLFSLMYRSSMINQLKGQILHFVGIKPARLTFFAPASHANTDQVKKWLKTVDELGRAGA